MLVKVRIVISLVRNRTKREEEGRLGQVGPYNVLFLDLGLGFMSMKVAVFLRYV